MKQLSEKDLSKVETFFKAYDLWATSSDLCGGVRFDNMLEARGELEHVFRPIVCPEEKGV